MEKGEALANGGRGCIRICEELWKDRLFRKYRDSSLLEESFRIWEGVWGFTGFVHRTDVRHIT